MLGKPTVHQLVEAIRHDDELNAIIANPSLLLEAAYGMFAPLRATVPEYAKYLRTLESATGLAVNHKTRVAVYLS